MPTVRSAWAAASLAALALALAACQPSALLRIFTNAYTGDPARLPAKTLAYSLILSIFGDPTLPE